MIPAAIFVGAIALIWLILVLGIWSLAWLMIFSGPVLLFLIGLVCYLVIWIRDPRLAREMWKQADPKKAR